MKTSDFGLSESLTIDSLGLLQMAIKVTNEPPKGIKAGMYRTFTTMINGDFLEKVETFDYWRSLVFAV